MRPNSVDAISSQQSYNTTRSLNIEKNNQHSEIEKNKSSNSQPDSLREKAQYTEQEFEEEVKESVKESVKDVNEIVDKVKEGISFQIHEDTEELMVQVIDIKTNEVIKELPPEEMLDLKARIHEMVGIIIDEKV